MNYSHIIIIIGLLCLKITAQEKEIIKPIDFEEVGVFPIQNFDLPKKDGFVNPYNIRQHPNGLIYFTVNSGIIEFDGVRFQNIYENNKVNYFSISDLGDIYTMTSKDFGVLKTDTKSGHIFTSLRQSFKIKDNNFGQDLGCYAIGRDVFFVYSKYVFKYSSDEFKVYEAKNFFKNAFEVGNVLYVNESGGGIYKVEDEDLKSLKGTEALPKRTLIHGIEQDERLLLSDTFGQFYNYDKTLQKEFKLSDHVDFSDALFIKISDEQYALSTKNHGVLIYSADGELLSVIKKSSGLSSNHITDLWLDNQKGLWIAHKKGIARVEIFSPFSFYNSQNGLDGRIMDILRHQDQLYCTSKNVLYTLDNPKESVFPIKKFRKIRSFDFSIRHFSYQDLLLITSSEGIFAYENDKIQKISDVGATFIIESDKYKGVLVLAGEFGIEVLQDRGAMFPLAQRFSKIGEIKLSDTPIEVSNLLELKNGDFLVNVDYKDLYKIRITSLSKFASEKEKLKLPLENVSHITLQSLANVPVLLVNGKVFIYEEKEKSFKEHSINKLIEQLDFTPYLLAQYDKESSIFLSSGQKTKTVIATKTDAGIYNVEKQAFSVYPNFIFWRIFPEKDSIIWFGGNEGMTRFDMKAFQRFDKLPLPMIREVAVDNDSIIFRGITANQKTNPQIQYVDNSVKIKYALPFFNDIENTEYSYILEGYHKDWSDWSSTAEKEFSNLFEGNYRFKLKARNTNGRQSDEISFAFKIHPPLYRTWWAYSLYGFGFIVFVILVVRWRSAQLQKEKDVLETIVKERTSEIIQKNKQLEIQADQLKEMDHVKSHFFANISHEFRTPLTLIKGPISDLLREKKKELSEGNIKMIHRNTDHLLRLVNQLLDLSKLDSGNLKIEPSEGDLCHYLRVISSSFNSYAIRRNIDYKISIPQSKIIVLFDKDKVEKIVYNLLSNAFKFTPENGEVGFLTSIEEHELKVVIIDNGKGIRKDQLPNIFDRFYQIDDSVTRDQEGTGIGLSLTKELVTLMNGEIEVESEIDKGTAFTIKIPIEIVKKKKTKASITDIISENEVLRKNFITEENNDKSIDKQRPIVLVVEDNEDMRKYIASYLKEDYCVLEAADGLSGLEIALKEIPDLIITDLMMPQIDGISLCKKIRSDEKVSHIPIIMLTAKAQKKSKMQGLVEGVDDYLTKPFDSEELVARVINLIDQRRKLRTLYSQQVTLEPKQIAITSLDEAFLDNIIQSVEENLSDSEYGVKELQEHLSMSKTQLHRKMKALTDQAPGEFLRNYRLKRAAQIIVEQGDNISQIAFTVGFNSPSYFTKCFKEFYGESPSEFLKKSEINS